MRVGEALGRLGAWVLLAAMPCGAYALAKVALWQWENWPALWDVDDALALVAAAVGALVAGYLALSALVMVTAAALRKGRVIPARARALAPAAWQRVAAVALGVGLSSGVAVPAMASIQTPPGFGWADAPATTEQASDEAPMSVRLDWGAATVPAQVSSPVSAPAPVTEQATVAEQATAGPVLEEEQAPPSQRGASHAYVVQPGDSLWGITSGLLGETATNADIESLWPVLYEENRAVIGDNPSLIFVGTELRVPAELAQ